MTAKEARQKRVCMRCECAAILANRKDGAGERAVLWCTPCGRIACGGDSFVKVATEGLPIVGELA